MKFVPLLLIALIASNTYANSTLSVCGKVDNRIPSYHSEVGKVVSKITGTNACTATLIGKSCMVTAGHCVGYLNIAEFNVPWSVNGVPSHSEPRDQYLVIRDSIVSIHQSPGRDWAVFRTARNALTGFYPGEVQGYVPVRFAALPLSDAPLIVRITGHGKDTEPDRNRIQQTHTGKIIEIDPDFFRLKYQVDTDSGNSGSAIILEETGELIGVHTNGGCTDSEYSHNSGTSLYFNRDLYKAVQDCLEKDLYLE